MAVETDPGQTRAPGSVAGQLGAPLRNFMATEAGSAGLLLIAALVALAWANSPWSDRYFSFWSTELAIRLGDDQLTKDLHHWVNDGLMTLFFFVLGLEVRRELSVGELTETRRVVVPLLGAVTGIAVPAVLYLAFNPSGDAATGWGVVIGTDTAFLLGALTLVGPRISTQLRLLLLTMTVFDDLIAVSVIGFVYSDSINYAALAIAIGCLAVMALLDRLGNWRATLYVIVGVVLWLATVESGIHPTIAGMAAGLMISARVPRRDQVERAATLFQRFRQSPTPNVGYQAHVGLQQAVSVNERLQEVMHRMTSFIIVPIFALANAGVDLRGGVLSDAMRSPVTWGVVVGLVVGKTMGISLGTYVAVKSGRGVMPVGIGWGQLVGGAALSGIGFTVSLLIVDLGFESQTLRDEATVGVLIAAVLAVIVGAIVFRLAAVLLGERTATLPLVLSEPVDPAHDHIRGRVDAPLTLVEYADFECPFCSAATGVVDELRARFGDDLRYVFRHLPLTHVHPHAELAAEAAEAAGAQGRFWELHDVLFEHQDQLEFEDLLGYADEIGLRVEEFARSLGQRRFGERVEEDVESAAASGARGTPTFFVGTRRHVGPYDVGTLAAELEASRTPPVLEERV